MSERRYEGRPANRRRARAHAWTFRDGDDVARGVRLRIEDKHMWLSPEKAYALANKLVDLAEQAEAVPDPAPLAADKG